MYQKLKIKSFQASLLFLGLLTVNSVIAQIINYDGTGNRVQSSSEKISIVINKKADHVTESSVPPISLPGVIGSFVGLGADVVKSILSSQEAKYTASYTATRSENELIYLRNHLNKSSADLNIDSINVFRTFKSEDFRIVQACDIVLVPQVESNSGLFRFKVERLSIPYSKAKIKKAGKNGKMIDISIAIKLDAFWKEASGTIKQDSGAHAKEGAVAGGIADSSFQIKTATLGETTILISSITPGGDILINEDYYSGWFQLIPATALKYANAENKWRLGNYSLTITVKEANPYAISSKKISDFFNSTGTDIVSLIKQFFPNPSK